MSKMLEKIKRRALQSGRSYSWEDIKKLREEDEKKQCTHFKAQFDEHKARALIGRSGILPLHRGCTIDNFIADTHEKNYAKQFSRYYIDNFEKNIGSGFIFSGGVGTGKNHLAAAICNELIKKGKSVLVITVTELMQKLRKCYKIESEISEDEFIQTMIDFDLLVLDEIGLQRGTDAERLALNQIIDQRVSRFRPTGMLTNLPANSSDNLPSMNSVLGVRIMDRMRSNGGKWISFNWESFRK